MFGAELVPHPSRLWPIIFTWTKSSVHIRRTQQIIFHEELIKASTDQGFEPENQGFCGSKIKRIRDSVVQGPSGQRFQQIKKYAIQEICESRIQ